MALIIVGPLCSWMSCTVAFPVNPKRRVKLVSSQQLAYQNLFVGVNLVNALVQKLGEEKGEKGDRLIF
jgi:hypothetical protein